MTTAVRLGKVRRTIRPTGQLRLAPRSCLGTAHRYTQAPFDQGGSNADNGYADAHELTSTTGCLPREGRQVEGIRLHQLVIVAISRWSPGRALLSPGSSFGGALGAAGVTGLVSRGPVHHPAADPLFAVVGVAAALPTMALALSAQRHDRFTALSAASAEHDRICREAALPNLPPWAARQAVKDWSRRAQPTSACENPRRRVLGRRDGRQVRDWRRRDLRMSR